MTTQRTSFTYKLDDDQQATLTRILREGNYRPMRVEHTSIAAATEDCRICLYKSGKCLVQGRGAADFVTFVLEPHVLQHVELGYEDIVNPEAARPHMGVDESGKGDFFGPLVVVGAYVDETLTDALREMGVKDSKRITSDKKALALGREIRKTLGRRYSIVKIGPEAYNRLYGKMRNVNTLLAWAHSRAIENVLDIVPDCPRAVSDQFGSKRQVEKALMKKGRGIELEQRPRAEDDMAVAAASVIAREMFLRALQDFSSTYAIAFQKGASAKVRETAVELAKKEGPEVLAKTAKCHFRTTDQVLAELGLGRDVLGEAGRAVSRPAGNYRRRSSST